MKNALILLFITIFFSFVPGIFFSQNPEIKYDRNGIFTIVPSLEKPHDWGKTGDKGEHAFWQIYFWDFGDGTYYFFRAKPNSKVDPPVHFYTKSQIGYSGAVYITPRISPDKTLKIPFNIRPQDIVTGKKNLKWLTDMEDVKKDKQPQKEKTSDLIDIQASEDICLIPGDEIRIAVHYKAPVIGNGTLLLFYNNNEGPKGRIEPLKFSNVDPYHQNSEINISSTSPFIKEIRDKYVSKGFKECKVYAVKNMAKDEERRLFFSLQSDKSLEKHLKGAPVTFHLLGIWVPSEATSFDKANPPSCKVEFKLNGVHDPNNIQGPKTRYFRRGGPKLLNYEVNFENDETGIAKHVKIKIPIGKGFNADSFKLGQTDPECKICPKPRTNTQMACYEILPYTDSIIVTIYNIGLFRQNGLFKRKFARGSFDFSILSDGKAKPKSVLQAEITFDGTDSMLTRKAVTRWRHRALYLKPGYIFGVNKSTYYYYDKSRAWLDDLNGSIAYQNSPIGSGFVWGGEIGIGTLRFNSFNIHHLETKVMVGYQLGTFARITCGCGILTPTSAFTNSFELGVYEPIIKIRPYPGVSCQWGLELGFMNGIALGLENQLRVFPKLSEDNSVTLSNFNVYLRFKIFPLVGKGR